MKLNKAKTTTLFWHKNRPVDHGTEWKTQSQIRSICVRGITNKGPADDMEKIKWDPCLSPHKNIHSELHKSSI